MTGRSARTATARLSTGLPKGDDAARRWTPAALALILVSASAVAFVVPSQLAVPSRTGLPLEGSKLTHFLGWRVNMLSLLFVLRM